jgi:hypothetical protein
LVDASGAQAPHTGSRGHEDGPGLVPVERLSRPTALLQQMAEETETEEESLVLTDTAPLAVSAETEYLARFVDCVIVVIESGKTTRRELREAAATVQRLDVGAVGFVLNRVGLAKADPAFCTSIQAIEEHLQAQSSKVTRQTERSKTYFSREQESREPLPNETSARTLFEPEVAAVAAAVARFSPQAVSEAASSRASEPVAEPVAGSASAVLLPEDVEPAVSFSPPPITMPPVAPSTDVTEFVSSPVVDEPGIELATPEVTASASGVATELPSSTIVEPAELEQLHTVPEESSAQPAAAAIQLDEPEPRPDLEEAQPATNPSADVPWWLSDESRVRTGPTRPPLLWRPASVWSSRKSDTASESLPSGPNANLESIQVKGAERGSWETASGGNDASSTGDIGQDTERLEPEENPTNLASRLSGLRNLFFVLGVKGPYGSEDAAEQEADSVSSIGPRIERSEADRTQAQDAEDAARVSVGGASPRLITAPPEFLPPRPIVINVDREGGRAGESSTRQDRRAPYDNIQILPSKRGQYKKI